MLGIVLLNYKNYQETINCISSIRDNAIDMDYCIYVIDNFSPNDSFEKLFDLYHKDKDIKLKKSNSNNGFSSGNNIGFKMAINDGCDLILCSNTDVLFKKNSINLMIEEILKQTNCAVVGPKVFCSDGTIQNSNKGILDAKTFLLRKKVFRIFDFKGLNRKYTYADYNYSEPLVVKGMVSGCCFLIKSNVLQEIGYLDENVFLYHEEDILGYKLRRIGYFVELYPKAEIVHRGGASTSSSENAFTRYHKFRSGMYYLWVYTDISKNYYRFIGLCLRFMFFIKGIKNKEYLIYNKKLKSEFNNILHKFTKST